MLAVKGCLWAALFCRSHSPGKTARGESRPASAQRSQHGDDGSSGGGDANGDGGSTAVHMQRP
jgi:hypothetical protein